MLENYFFTIRTFLNSSYRKHSNGIFKLFLLLCAALSVHGCGGAPKCDNKEIVCVSHMTTDDGQFFGSQKNPVFEVFGVIQVGDSSDELEFTIDPLHNLPVNSLRVEMIGDNENLSQFELDTSDIPSSLQSNETSSFNVSFNPTSEGRKEVTIRITGVVEGIETQVYTFKAAGLGATINGQADLAWEKLIVGGVSSQHRFHVQQGITPTPLGVSVDTTCGPTSMYMILKYLREKRAMGDDGYGYTSTGNSLKEEFPDNTTLTGNALISKYLGWGAGGLTVDHVEKGFHDLYKDSQATTPYFSGIKSNFINEMSPSPSLADRRTIFINEIKKPFLDSDLPVIVVVTGHFSVLVGYDEVNELVYWSDTNKYGDQAHLQASKLDDFLTKGFMRGKPWEGFIGARFTE